MASNGRKLEALTVFSHSIRYLKDKAIEIIREVTGDDGYNAMDIQWVLTVPAIWKPAAKQFMREAAYMVNNTNTFFSHFVHFFLLFVCFFLFCQVHEKLTAVISKLVLLFYFASMLFCCFCFLCIFCHFVF